MYTPGKFGTAHLVQYTTFITLCKGKTKRHRDRETEKQKNRETEKQLYIYIYISAIINIYIIKTKLVCLYPKETTPTR